MPESNIDDSWISSSVYKPKAVVPVREAFKIPPLLFPFLQSIVPLAGIMILQGRLRLLGNFLSPVVIIAFGIPVSTREVY